MSLTEMFIFAWGRGKCAGIMRKQEIQKKREETFNIGRPTRMEKDLNMDGKEAAPLAHKSFHCYESLKSNEFMVQVNNYDRIQPSKRLPKNLKILQKAFIKRFHLRV